MTCSWWRRQWHQEPGPLARFLFLWPWATLFLLFLSAAVSAAPVIGVSVDLTALPAAAQEKTFTRLAENSVTSVHYELDWNRVEPTPAHFQWARDDAVIKAALAHHFDVVLVLGPTATWSVDPALGVAPELARYSVPKSLSLWERYVRQAALHYRGKVRTWQVREQPNTNNFRGSVQEFFTMLQVTAQVLREVDPQNRLIIPEPVGFDPAGMDRRLKPPVRHHWDMWGAYLPSYPTLSPGALALSVMTTEMYPPSEPPRPIWVIGAEAILPADRWVQYYLLTSAFGIARFYAPEPAISREWTSVLAPLTYRGFLHLGPILWALVFNDGADPVVVAWSDVETRLPVSQLAPVVHQEQLARSAPLGSTPGLAVDMTGTEPVLLLGPRPVLLRGLEVSAAQFRTPTRADVLHGRGVPDLRALPAVSVNYTCSEQPEFGLYNRALRALPGGAIREVEHGDRIALGTIMQRGSKQANADEPWIYFDVDDSWLYFARGQVPIVITVEVQSSLTGPEKIGFNIQYEAVDGYRSTHWQWVDAGEDWRTYCFEINNASFTNRNGYDFRINAQGSRQDVWVSSVKVEKVSTLPPLSHSSHSSHAELTLTPVPRQQDRALRDRLANW